MIKIPGVKKTIFICSGKGGVGKSTITTQIALTMSKLNYAVGILDADIYGASIPKLLQLNSKPTIENNKFIPIGTIKVMSAGFMMEENQAIIWRAPMITKMLQQLALQTQWNCEGELDYLLVDTPPGTGDVHLSFLQNYHIDYAIVISTPQEVAVSNAAKSIDLLSKLNFTTNIGIIDNMIFLNQGLNPDDYIFGRYKLSIQYPNIHKIGEIPFFNHNTEIFNEIVFNLTSQPSIQIST